MNEVESEALESLRKIVELNIITEISLEAIENKIKTTKTHILNLRNTIDIFESELETFETFKKVLMEKNKK